MPLRILLLGGTGEARRLAQSLASRADLAPLLSFAGRTAIPADQPAPFRVGGFGGVEGLAAFLRAERFDAVVDATHPFAARISANAVAACNAAAVPLARLVRPAWEARLGDRWQLVETFERAAHALGAKPRRVLLTIGQGGVEAFAVAPPHAYFVRSINAPDLSALAHARALLDRPPYTVEGEEALMRELKIDILVTKNSGGGATGAKLQAARRLGLEVVMIERPERRGHVPEFGDENGLLDWLNGVQAERGV